MSILQGIFGNASQLNNEKHKAILKGPADHIARLKKMDKAIGQLVAPFNGVARVPENITAKIDALVKENAFSMTQVVAVRPYEENTIEALGSWVRGASKTTEVPIDWLEYETRYRSQHGNTITQRVAQFRVGS